MDVVSRSKRKAWEHMDDSPVEGRGLYRADEEEEEGEGKVGRLGQDETLVDALERLDPGAGREMSLDDDGFNKRNR